jgi:hypothetical protein
VALPIGAMSAASPKAMSGCKERISKREGFILSKFD